MAIKIEDIEKRVLDKIDEMRDEIIRFHQQIVQIPSENPPSRYKTIAKFTEAKMKEIGLSTLIKKNNVIGEWKNGTGRSLIFYGHYDTVESFKGWTKKPHGGEIIDGKIYGRGSSDDKSCVTAEIFAIQALLESNVNLKGKLTLTAVGDEETGGFAGAEYLLSHGLLKADACLLGDAPYGYPIGYCGGGMFPTFVIEGKQAHGMGNPDVPEPHRDEHSGINAIQRMVKVMDFLLDMKKEINQTATKYPLPGNWTSQVSDINLGVIKGGTKISIVPNRCFLHTSVNTIPEQDIESLKQRIISFIEKFKEEDPLLDINLQIPIAYEPQIVNQKTKFAQTVKNAFRTIFNEEREFKLFISTTDAHWFQERGIDTILIGATRSENNAHAEDEFVYIDDLINVTKIYALTALNYLT
jgi:succinyl-diaminopimelate desuccinylase